MTNAEKYEEVFGMRPDIQMCPTEDCYVCPEYFGRPQSCRHIGWWKEEYKEPKK